VTIELMSKNMFTLIIRTFNGEKIYIKTLLNEVVDLDKFLSAAFAGVHLFASFCVSLANKTCKVHAGNTLYISVIV